MALFRKFFYRKPPDGLLEISERVYVFDCCFSTDVFEDDEYKDYMGGIVGKLRDHFPDASFMVFNFREGENQSLISSILLDYDMTVMDYPRHYEGCPLLTMEMIHHFLRSSESWLSLGQQNLLLMHCERGGWPVLAFMLAGLLIYRKQYTGEQKTLDMIYKQAPRELLQLLAPLNPMPSQLRYLQYVSRRNVASKWPPLDRALTLDCVIIRIIPNFDGEGGCRPIFRIYGQDPSIASDRTPKVLFSTPKKSKSVRLYRQADCELVKIDIHCDAQGDVVLECISLDEDLEREEMMFRVMFNTAFIRSNILILNRDEIDVMWDAKDRFPKDFRAEVLFSEMDGTTSPVPTELMSVEEKEGLPMEAFAKVQEIFNSVDWLEGKGDVALQVLQHIKSSNALQEKLEALSPHKVEKLSPRKVESLSPQNDQAVPTKQNPSSHALQEKLEALSPHIVEKLSPQKVERFPSQNVEAVPTKRKTTSNALLEQLEATSPHKVEKLSPQKEELEALSPNKVEKVSRPKVERLSPQNIEAVPTKQKSGSGVLKEGVQADASQDVTKKASISVPKQQPASFVAQLPESHTRNQSIQVNDFQAALQRPSQPKIISQRVPSSSWSSPVSSNNLLQGSLTPVSRYHSAPPVLGITALLHDHAAFGSSEFTHTMRTPSSPSLSMVAAAVPSEPAGQHVPSTTSPMSVSVASAVSPAEKASTVPTNIRAQPPPQIMTQLIQPHPQPAPSLRHASIEAVSPSTSSIPPPSPPHVVTSPTHPPPPPVVASVPYPPLPQPVVASARPPPPPPPPPLPPPTIASAPLSRPPPPPPPPSLPRTSSTPPPPPPQTCSSTLAPPPTPPRTCSSRPPPQTCSSSPPPPPPFASNPLPSPSVKKVSSCSHAPPPPPPPLRSGHALPASAPSTPPPPPPLNLAKNSGASISQKSLVAPPVPPPPTSFTHGNGAGIPSSHTKRNNCDAVPPPPSNGMGAKGRGLARTGPRNAQSTQGSARRTTLKPLHWVKVTRAMQGSLWAETQKSDEASKAPEFDMSELESLFSAAVPSSELRDPADKSRRSSLGSKSDKIHLIDLRRANNCEIMLTKVKMPLPDLMSSVLALDDSVLDGDQVDNLIKFCPTKEEMELLKNYNGDKESLGKCEQFFLELMKIPRVESKLRVFSFKIQFRSQVADLSSNLNIVNSAAEEVRNSIKLKRIMQTILSLGNALNQGTARGSAIGFRLDSLLKLTDTRARNNKMTLMHYLCKVLADKLPELLDFPKDLVNLEAVSKIQLKYLAEEMQAISKGLEKVEQELTNSENDGPVSHIFHKTLKEFLVIAEADVRALTSLYSGVGRNADALALYFGEDPIRCPFEQVISTLLNFVRMFVRAHEENCKQLELEKKKAQKEAENEKLKFGASKKESDNLLSPPIRNASTK